MIKTLHAVVAMIPGTTKSIASYVDISEQKKYEDALTLVNRKLNLLSSITRHDIINQLMVLKGYLAMLKLKTDNPVLLDYIGHSDLAARNIERQMNFTRDYQDMGVKAPLWQNVRSIIIGAKGALPVGNVTVDMERPDIEVFADPLFEKVFYNLIENSLRYGGEKLRTIRISSQERDDCLVITCQDDGVGIADSDRVHLFERGFGKHTGFGLFLSREILSITGISIRETGKSGMGARFEIIIPKGGWRFANTK
jgi:signal transduction histidine kinase